MCARQLLTQAHTFFEERTHKHTLDVFACRAVCRCSECGERIVASSQLYTSAGGAALATLAALRMFGPPPWSSLTPDALMLHGLQRTNRLEVSAILTSRSPISRLNTRIIWPDVWPHPSVMSRCPRENTCASLQQGGRSNSWSWLQCAGCALTGLRPPLRCLKQTLNYFCVWLVCVCVWASHSGLLSNVCHRLCTLSCLRVWKIRDWTNIPDV